LPTLPDIKSRVVLDDSQLKNVGKTASATGAALEAGMGKGTASLSKFSGALSGVMGMAGLGGLPQTALKGTQALEGMTSTGVSGMTLLGGAALAGVGLMAAAVEHSISSYIGLADQVENDRRVVGGSAGESGRMVQTFDALGVSGDTASAAMFKLSKAVETTPKKFADLGVEVAHDAAGNVDLSKTLLSVADAYNATSDQAKKNLIVFDAFGKSGKDMIPVLEQGSASLTKMEQAAKITFSEQDLQAAKDYQIQLTELQQGLSSVWEGIGQKVVPQLVNLMDRQKETSGATSAMTDAMKAGTVSQLDYQLASLGVHNKARDVYDAFIAEYEAGHKLKGALDEAAAATAAATKANDDLWTSADKVITQLDNEYNAGDALARANIAVEGSADKVTKAQDALTLATQQYGASSEQARTAGLGLQTALLDQERDYRSVGAAALKLQQDTDLASGAGANARLEVNAQIAALQAEADTLAPGSALRVYLDGYINTLKNEIPRDVFTNVHLQTIDQRIKSGTGYAEGGRPPVGPVFMVGEQGPELMRLDSPATVYPHGQDAGGGAADMSQVEELLRESNAVGRAQVELLSALAADAPGGGTGIEAAVYKLMQTANLNRMRGGAGA
jgi:hypothetical protein